jgi:hypothetical protein
LDSPNVQKASLLLTPQVSYHPIEPLQLTSLTIRRKSDNPNICKIEMRVHNPNKHFFLPGSITRADEQRIAGKTLIGQCDGQWTCGGKDLFPNGPKVLMACFKGSVTSEISYTSQDEIMLRGLRVATEASTSIGRNQMGLKAAGVLEPENLPKTPFCSAQECTWANITMPITEINFRWQTGGFWCDPSICQDIGVLVPMTFD